MTKAPVFNDRELLQLTVYSIFYFIVISASFPFVTFKSAASGTFSVSPTRASTYIYFFKPTRGCIKHDRIWFFHSKRTAAASYIACNFQNIFNMDHIHSLLSNCFRSRLTIHFFFDRYYKYIVSAAFPFHNQCFKRLFIWCPNQICTVKSINKLITFIWKCFIFHFLTIQHSHRICLSFFCHVVLLSCLLPGIFTVTFFFYVYHHVWISFSRVLLPPGRLRPSFLSAPPHPVHPHQLQPVLHSHHSLDDRNLLYQKIPAEDQFLSVCSFSVGTELFFLIQVPPHPFYVFFLYFFQV